MRLVLCLAAVVVVVAGCGGGGTANDPRSVAEAFGKAIANEDWGKACSLMTTDAKAALLVAGAFGGKTGSCEKAWSGVMGFLDTADREKIKQTHVTSVKVNGDTATARYSTDSNEDSPTRLVKKSGRWLVDKDPDEGN